MVAAVGGGTVVGVVGCVCVCVTCVGNVESVGFKSGVDDVPTSHSSITTEGKYMLV